MPLTGPDALDAMIVPLVRPANPPTVLVGPGAGDRAGGGGLLNECRTACKAKGADEAAEHAVAAAGHRPRWRY